MSSLLIITPVERLQDEIERKIRSLGDMPGVYVSLNKTQRGVEQILQQSKISINKLFFIDCVSSENVKEDILYISPNNLDGLVYAINDFSKEIHGKKFLIIDALSTLLIYNSENKVAAFVKEVTECASRENVEVVALSPSTKGEELLNKIFNFFDKVEKDKNENKEIDNDREEELVY
jgi:archaellum biogenesis ATPase FlaH